MDLLGELGLTEKADQRADSLSGGERRRVEITRALVLDPKFMLLDEPFTGIDPDLGDRHPEDRRAAARSAGIGIVITEHNVRETLAICDRAYIIKDGEIIRHGHAAGDRRGPEVREIYLGENFRLG